MESVLPSPETSANEQASSPLGPRELERVLQAAPDAMLLLEDQGQILMANA